MWIGDRGTCILFGDGCGGITATSKVEECFGLICTAMDHRTII